MTGGEAAYWRRQEEEPQRSQTAVPPGPTMNAQTNAQGESARNRRRPRTPQVHSGADLQASASAAAPHVPGGAKPYLGHVLSHANSPDILPLLEAAVEARTELLPALRSSRCAPPGARRGLGLHGGL
jgi:hypothetical protein